MLALLLPTEPTKVGAGSALFVGEARCLTEIAADVGSLPHIMVGVSSVGIEPPSSSDRTG